jgi:hypothetical protein
MKPDESKSQGLGETLSLLLVAMSIITISLQENGKINKCNKQEC